MTYDRPDPAFLPLLSDSRASLRPPGDEVTLADYRRRLDRPMAAARGPDVATVETVELETGLCLRVYAPTPAPLGTILFLHGGGFVVGSLETHDAMCRTLAVLSGARVVAVGYRLAPEAPFPAARDDCRAALDWTISRNAPGSVALCGDSAGGHLATGLALHAAGHGLRLAALGLLYPVADPACASATWQRFGTGHVLTHSWMRWAWSVYLAGADPASPEFTLPSARLAGLPPTRMVVAECDPLRDEGGALAAAITASGATVALSRAAGMIHGFASLPMLTPAADQALQQLANHFRQHMR